MKRTSIKIKCIGWF